MELTGETLEAIGRYVRGNLGIWIREINLDRDIELRERTVRVEEELKAQRELMREGFAQSQKRFELMQEQIDRRFDQTDKHLELIKEQMGQRFEAVDKRFEAVDKRFEDMRSYSVRWFTAISIMLTVVGVAVTVSSFV